MSYFKQLRIEDENGNIVQSDDLRGLDQKQLLLLILVELKKITMHMKIMTDEEIDTFDIGE